MYKDIYAPLPDAAQYLKRIGIDEILEPTRENLDKIIYAHITHVPFENLDECMDKACPSLNIPDLFDKIVVRNRGGYCFELNAALYALLQALGYEAYPVACRILWGHGLFMPLSHRATIVVIDGVKHFCDVGFGGPSAHCAVPYNETVDGGFFVKVVGRDTQIMRKTEDGEELLITYVDSFFEPIDFIPLNFNVAMAPGSFFQMMPMLNLTTDTGSKAINGDIYRVHHNGEVTETKIENDEMMRKIMKEEFGLVK
ncbi:MAG: arylamine N-acetyltransferase [Oscillospiraceae bacterium]|nr:arylamine N-acetyltransferase [Oscillospiraceae bacterium]